MSSSFIHQCVFSPNPLLVDFVQNILVIDASLHNPAQSSLEGIYPPTPQNCIFLYLKEPLKAKKVHEEVYTERPRAVVVGPQVTRMKLLLNRHHKVAVIGFQPGGLHRLLGIPMSELFDEGFDGMELLGPEINTLIDRCSEISSLEEIKNRVEDFLLSKLPIVKELRPIDNALKYLIRNGGNVSIAGLAADACLSLRQFERKCYERVGMSPKLYARIIRFSNAYRMFERAEQPDWSMIAYQAGYFDQAHFIKDFKQFSGIAPGLMQEEILKVPLRLQKTIKI